MNYNHVMCSRCGGIVQLFNDGRFQCRECGEEITLRGCEYDILIINDKTGWKFPMLYKNNQIK